jgi:hypothetical protein
MRETSHSGFHDSDYRIDSVERVEVDVLTAALAREISETAMA